MNAEEQLSDADIEEWVSQAWDEAEREAEAARCAFLYPELRRIYYNARDAGDLDHEEALALMEDAVPESGDAGGRR